MERYDSYDYSSSEAGETVYHLSTVEDGDRPGAIKLAGLRRVGEHDDSSPEAGDYDYSIIEGSNDPSTVKIVGTPTVGDADAHMRKLIEQTNVQLSMIRDAEDYRISASTLR